MSRSLNESEEEVMNLLSDVIDRWCNTSSEEETLKIRMTRALLNINAYEEDHKRVMNGYEPIRNDYPVKLPEPTYEDTKNTNHIE